MPGRLIAQPGALCEDSWTTSDLLATKASAGGRFEMEDRWAMDPKAGVRGFRTDSAPPRPGGGSNALHAGLEIPGNHHLVDLDGNLGLFIHQPPKIDL